MSDQAGPRQSPSMTMRHPHCTHDETECRVSTRSRVTTAIAWEPVYDGTGAMKNEDPNTFETEYSCGCCAMKWTVRRTGSRTEVVL